MELPQGILTAGFLSIKKHSGEYGWVVIKGWTCIQELFFAPEPQSLYLNLLKKYFGGKGGGDFVIH